MANHNCQACDDLKSSVPNLIVNGMGDAECASLQNDTGLNPSSGHNDCTDLNNLNDCLVGNMEQELEAYDVCEWKPFMKRFIPNLWTTLKGVVCAICGIWTNIHNLWAKIAEILTEINNLWARTRQLCDMITAQIGGKGGKYGVFPRRTFPHGKCGFIPTKNGRPALIDQHYTSHNADEYTGVGIEWGVVEGVDCASGSKRTVRFWEPYVYGYALNSDIEIGDPLWVVSKSQIQSLIPSMDDAWWQAYTDETWTWTTGVFTDGSVRGKTIWLRFHVGDAGYSNDYLVLTFAGTSYPSAAPGYDADINMTNESEFRWG